jgi:hypothetical protein
MQARIIRRALRSDYSELPEILGRCVSGATSSGTTSTGANTLHHARPEGCSAVQSRTSWSVAQFMRWFSQCRHRLLPAQARVYPLASHGPDTSGRSADRSINEPGGFENIGAGAVPIAESVHESVQRALKGGEVAGVTRAPSILDNSPGLPHIRSET